MVGGVSSGGGTAIEGALAYAANSAVYDMRCQILVLATLLSLPRAIRGRCACAQSFFISMTSLRPVQLPAACLRRHAETLFASQPERRLQEVTKFVVSRVGVFSHPVRREIRISLQMQQLFLDTGFCLRSGLIRDVTGM